MTKEENKWDKDANILPTVTFYFVENVVTNRMIYLT